MVIADTSVWVSYFREGNTELENLLNNGEVMCHPFVVGELACGNLKNRNQILSLLQSLPMGINADHVEVLEFIERNQLMGKGLGYVDIHLIASALLTGISIWTHDKKLEQGANALH
jgi:hypothetical protein